jgi:uncharacterized membrane protein
MKNRAVRRLGHEASIRYLSLESFQEELDDGYNIFNARRELDEKKQLEKHRHFFERIIRSALDRENLEETLRRGLKQTTQSETER